MYPSHIGFFHLVICTYMSSMSYGLIAHFFLVLNNIPLSIVSEKAMASHSSTLAWKIPWTEEPGGLQSMGSLRVGHD